MNINIKQYLKAPTGREIERFEHLIMMLPHAGSHARWPAFAHDKVIAQRLSRSGYKGTPAKPFPLDLPNKTGTRVSLVGIKQDISSFELLTLARELVATHMTSNPSSIAISLPGIEAPLAARSAEAIVSAALAARHVMPSFKSKPDKPKKLRAIHLYLAKQNKLDFSQCIAEAEGNNLARELTSLPPNELTPGNYRKRVTKLAKEHGWKMDFLDTKKLKREKAGAFLAVAQGSPEPDAGIVHLCYTPKQQKGTRSKQSKGLALVGKGICFDTGGTNLKPARYMHGMHEDMEGSAVALGTFLALTQLEVNFPVDCWLALAQNHIGPRAYKQNDVVTACNGTTIEVIHTDAEGRMVLADTLAIASRNKPAMIVDYATLTGACVQALSTRYSGAFTNKPDLVSKIIKAGEDSGERVWPFPTEKDFDTELDSDIADIKQCTLGGEADHILAARFLDRFVDKKIAWVHIDLSAGNHKNGLAHIPTDITGFGVRYTLNLVLRGKGVGVDFYASKKIDTDPFSSSNNI